ncbi:helix-turn-helix domain-containing protein [Desulfallas sp. Bu1-1]|uniref:helix-turn-helix domain-containing protein n=1 Tax=Desulfallas sp. Bu1-1 TaxID=2787620 RepID=UPI0018A07243|nr:helix-turn-helix domain-containing protein [Desulfallas sp. Bu1-1]MBF7081871.1 helix-turn-helix domain-containing protein [Desulfallas sp. Bu1-1]
MDKTVTFTELNTYLEDGRKRGWFWDYNEVFESDLSAHAKLVRLYLAKCADNGRKSWPSYNKIAKDCGISRDTAKRVINELEQKGWLKKITRIKDNGENMSNVYILCDPPENELDREGTRGTKPANTEGVGAHSTHPANLEGVGAHSTGVGAHSTQVGAHSTRVGAVTASNNTQITIPSEENKLFGSSLRSEPNNSASAFHASCAGSILSHENNNSDSHPQAGVADAAGEEIRTMDQGSAKTGELPTKKELIAELVKEYRAVEGVKETRGDYAFIGALYNRYGYDIVLEAIQELALATTVQEIHKPLLYLKAVVQAIANRGEKPAGMSTPKKESPGMSDWSAYEDKKKKREIIKSLYMN